MDIELLKELIYHGSEERNLEYKKSMSWNDNNTKSKLVKTCLAMANISYGGTLIFGVEEKTAGVFEPIGMNKIDADSFNQDDVSDYVNKYADPYVELKIDKIVHDDKLFIVIQIQEYEVIPVICKKNGEGGLFKGAVYTRPRRKIESVPIPSQTEMRELLDNSLTKKLIKLKETISLMPSDAVNIDDNKNKFDEQLGDL